MGDITINEEQVETLVLLLRIDPFNHIFGELIEGGISLTIM